MGECAQCIVGHHAVTIYLLFVDQALAVEGPADQRGLHRGDRGETGRGHGSQYIGGLSRCLGGMSPVLGPAQPDLRVVHQAADVGGPGWAIDVSDGWLRGPGR